MRHRIRKDLRRSRVTTAFEKGLDTDPEAGALYRLMTAYAALDPDVGYVQVE